MLDYTLERTTAANQAFENIESSVNNMAAKAREIETLNAEAKALTIQKCDAVVNLIDQDIIGVSVDGISPDAEGHEQAIHKCSGIALVVAALAAVRSIVSEAVKVQVRM